MEFRSGCSIGSAHPGFPVWLTFWRILRFSCLPHNKWAIAAGLTISPDSVKGDFFAGQTNSDSALYIDCAGLNGISDAGSGVETYNQDGLAGVPFIPVSATPEPGTSSLLLTGVTLLALMVVLRKRKVQGLAQAA